MPSLFNILITKLGYLMKLLGLPEKTAVAFVFGFFRRDFGAAGLYDMEILFSDIGLASHLAIN